MSTIIFRHKTDKVKKIHKEILRDSYCIANIHISNDAIKSWLDGICKCILVCDMRSMHLCFADILEKVRTL